MENITISGLTFAVTTEQDCHHGAPWEEEDCHGPVSEWREGRDKRAGERELCYDRGSYRYYDMREAMKIAKRDGWGLSPEARAKLSAKLKREPTAGEIRAESVQYDFDYLRRYCSGDWCYVVLIVTLLDADGDETATYECLGGMDSDSEEYIAETAHDLARGIAERIGRKKYINQGAKRIQVRA